jgi:hypothetical protein
MTWPPMLMHVRIENEEHDFGIWLPLFLFFLIILAILLVLSPLIFIAVLVLWPSGWGEWAMRTLWVAIVAVCSMRGLEVEVQGRNEYVHVSVI